MEAAGGHTNKGKFRGFKLHATVNQTGLPLRATVTPGNKFDKPFLSMLIDGLETDYVLADRAYRSKRNFQAISDRGAVPVIADNPRRKDKACKLESDVLLRTKHCVVEQFNGHLKDNVLGECWAWLKGPVKKASMVMAGLISMDANAVAVFVEDEERLKSASK